MTHKLKHADSWWVVQFGKASVAISNDTAEYIQDAFLENAAHIKFTSIYGSSCFFLMTHFVGMIQETRALRKVQFQKVQELEKDMYEIEEE